MRVLERLRISLRFGQYLLWEFRWPIGIFSSLILVGGLILHRWYHHHDLRYFEACYAVFCLIFLEPVLEFPDEWYLQPLFFLLPVVGLGAIADSIVRLAYLVFTRKQKLPEWNRMAASLCRNHVIVVGAGKVGYRVIKGLLELKETVVAIEREATSDLFDEILSWGVPVITGDARHKKTLHDAGVEYAKAVILATSDDLANLDAALTARELVPNVRVVLRLFDETLASKFAGAFSMPAISTASVAAPAFIAAATGRKVYQEFHLAGQQVYLIDMTIRADSRLVGMQVGDVQSDKQVNIVMHQGPTGVDVNPDHDVKLNPGDTILVIAPIERLIKLESANRPAEVAEREAQLIQPPAALTVGSPPAVTED
jgi:voltage-gated potassium channel